MNISKEYTLDVLWFTLAITPVIISLGTDLCITNTFFWFQRSGALMVLFVVLLELRKEQFTQPRESKGFTEKGEPLLLAVKMPNDRKKLKKMAIVFIITGTAIWAYGDI